MLKNNKITIYDEVLVKIRGRVIDVGPELVMVDLIELFQQNRVERPVYVAIPVEAFRSKVLKKEKLPPEVPM